MLTLFEVAFVALVVVILDQIIKFWVGRRLRLGAISLGALGKMEVSANKIWIAQRCRNFGPKALWGCWIVATAVVILLSMSVAKCAWFSALLVGGSASHALETARRGMVRDYVRVRFWPPFNLADVAITIGAIGLTIMLISVAFQH